MQFGKPMTIEEFIDATFDDPDDRQRLRDQIAACKLRRQMVAMRVARDVSQEDIQCELGDHLSQKIKTLEFEKDANLTISDVQSYASALGVVFTIEIDGSGVVDVKFRDKEITE